jgi:CRP-like cAMP-binding protein
MYFVAEGCLDVRLYRTDAATCTVTSTNGSTSGHPSWRELRAITVDDLSAFMYEAKGSVRPPGYFGQASCLAGKPAPATVVARECSQLYSLSRGDLMQVGGCSACL